MDISDSELEGKGEISNSSNGISPLKWLEKQCLDEYAVSPNSSACPRIFDGWTCWNETTAGSIAFNPCPFFISGFDSRKYAFKECLDDGTWFRHPESNLTWSNYTACVDPEEFKWRAFVISLQRWGYFISLIALTISLIIFCSIKSIDCTRVRIHKQLFLSFIIDNSMWVMWYKFVILNESVLIREPWWCKLLQFLTQFFALSNYFWMLLEGYYLHRLLVNALIMPDSNRLLCEFYIFGWLCPAIPLSIYAGLKSYYSYEDPQMRCWASESFQWVLSVPVAITLLLNLIFLVRIIFVLVGKLGRSRNERNLSDASQRGTNGPDEYSFKKAVKATLILIPLLGLHYLLIPMRPESGTLWEALYDIIAAAASSLQGLAISLLFCLFNSEILHILRRKFQSLVSRVKRFLCPCRNLVDGRTPEQETPELAASQVGTSMSNVIYQRKKRGEEEEESAQIYP